MPEGRYATLALIAVGAVRQADWSTALPIKLTQACVQSWQIDRR